MAARRGQELGERRAAVMATLLPEEAQALKLAAAPGRLCE
jgi:hypothetical protein